MLAQQWIHCITESFMFYLAINSKHPLLKKLCQHPNSEVDYEPPPSDQAPETEIMPVNSDIYSITSEEPQMSIALTTTTSPCAMAEPPAQTLITAQRSSNEMVTSILPLTATPPVTVTQPLGCQTASSENVTMTEEATSNMDPGIVNGHSDIDETTEFTLTAETLQSSSVATREGVTTDIACDFRKTNV